MRFLVCAVLLATTSTLYADVGGRVVDLHTGEPVVGANVRAGNQATVTDTDGRYHLSGRADSVAVTHVAYKAQIVAAALDGVIRLQRATTFVPEIVVRAGLSDESLQQSTSSVTVLTGERLASARHLQEVTASIPNLNWAGGTSRPQFFQIRGIGERSHYAGEGPPSFSVGTVIDDVDLSGLGTGGLLFDLDQVEVYRGAQSTIYGANAMAGLIHSRSVEPSWHSDRGLSFGIGPDGLLDSEAFVNVPVTADLAVRAGVAHGRSDGYRDNEFLRREDTNRRRESVGRVKGLWTPGDLRLTGTVFVTDMDNGYDAWAPDNNEDLRTFSDRPGVDQQQTIGASLRAEIPVTERLRLLSITAWSTTDMDYSFDGDWGNDSFWAGAPYQFDPEVEGYSYDFFDDMHRERGMWTQELRLRHGDLPIGGSGVIGAFVRDLTQDTDATGYLFGGDASDLVSTFDVDEVAVYGQHRRQLSDRLLATATLRADRNKTAYDGQTNGGTQSTSLNTDGWLAGGGLAVTWQVDASSQLFARLSRGYRAGGVNQNPRLADANRPYDAEYMNTVEAGWRWSTDNRRGTVALFYGRRSSQQVELSTQQDVGDPNSFVYFTNNAGAGHNTGVEVDGETALGRHLGLYGAVGLLRTQVEEYTFETGQGQRLSLGDRAAAHAPTYNASIGLRTIRRLGLQASIEVSAMDDFYFSDSHNQRSEAYTLLGASVGYRAAQWSVRLWGRNLLDERYATRGFYFGLEPPLYADTQYVSYGDPRQLGVTVSLRP